MYIIKAQNSSSFQQLQFVDLNFSKPPKIQTTICCVILDVKLVYFMGFQFQQKKMLVHTGSSICFRLQRLYNLKQIIQVRII